MFVTGRSVAQLQTTVELQTADFYVGVAVAHGKVRNDIKVPFNRKTFNNVKDTESILIRE